MLYVANPIGRLFEVRISGALTRADVDEHSARMREALLATPSKVIAIVDVHALEVMGPGAADRFLEIMRLANAKIERSAFLLPSDKTTLGLQMWRLLHEAHNPVRRTFEDRAPLAAWLGELLDERERDRLAAFLATPVGAEG